MDIIHEWDLNSNVTRATFMHLKEAFYTDSHETFYKKLKAAHYEFPVEYSGNQI